MTVYGTSCINAEHFKPGECQNRPAQQFVNTEATPHTHRCSLRTVEDALTCFIPKNNKLSQVVVKDWVHICILHSTHPYSFILQLTKL